MPDPDEVAAGNPFADPTHLPIRDVLADVEVWELEDASVGIAIGDADEPTFPALHLALREREPLTDPASPRREVVVLRFDLDALALLFGHVAAALKPDARQQLGALLQEDE